MRQETWKLMHGPMGTVVRTRASCSLFSANLLLSDEKVKHFSWKWAICRVLSVGSHRLTSLRSSDRNKRIWLRRQHRFLCLAERNERENVDNLAATCSARVKRPADQKQEKMNFFSMRRPMTRFLKQKTVSRTEDFKLMTLDFPFFRQPAICLLWWANYRSPDDVDTVSQNQVSFLFFL